ncbi:MAG TPA: hypothetical protein VFN67_16830 [Polyangiales bacterium]|jgi:hypothetical protein|nr:hypothetical protein [Polyangiales bacterium]
MSSRERWLGLSALLADAVEHATVAVERIHMQTAQRPFKLIEQIPPLAAPAHLVHEVHDTLVTLTYRQIRFWNKAVQKVVQVALEHTEPESK